MNTTKKKKKNSNRFIKYSMKHIPVSLLGYIVSFLYFYEKWNVRGCCKHLCNLSRSLSSFWGPVLESHKHDRRMPIILSELPRGACISSLKCRLFKLHYLTSDQPQVQHLELINNTHEQVRNVKHLELKIMCFLQILIYPNI